MTQRHFETLERQMQARMGQQRTSRKGHSAGTDVDPLGPNFDPLGPNFDPLGERRGRPARPPEPTEPAAPCDP
jgi:hypothetical protein